MKNINDSDFSQEYDNLGIYDNKNISVFQDGKWGIIDYMGNIVIPIQFGEIISFDGHSIRLKMNRLDHRIAEMDWECNEFYQVYSIGNIYKYESVLYRKFGLMDALKNRLTELEYDSIEYLNDINFKAQKDGSWGIIDQQGNTLLSFEYNLIYPIGNGYSKIARGSNWGITDCMGNVVVPTKLYEICGIYDNVIRVKATKDSEIAELNLNGEENLVYYKYPEVTVVESRLQNKFGLISNENQQITGLIFDSIQAFHNGKAKAKRGYYWGVIDSLGLPIIDFKFSEIGDFSDGIAPAKIYGKGFIDINGNEIYKYHDLEKTIIYESRLLKKFGIMSIDKIPITELLYDSMPKFHNDQAIVSINKKWGVINHIGGIVVPHEYDEVIETGICNYIVKKNRKYGVVNKSGDILVPIKYDRVYEKEGGLYCVREDSYGYWGVINESNVLVIPIKYDAIGVVKNNIVNVKKGKWWKKIVLKQEKSSKEMKSIKLDILEEGVVYNAMATGTMKFGVFIEIQDIGSGLIPAKEIFERNRKLKEFKKGTLIKVVLLKKDFQKNRATFKLSD